MAEPIQDQNDITFAEMAEMIALCATCEGDPIPGLPEPAIGPGWHLLFDSPAIGGFENKWQLWSWPQPAPDPAQAKPVRFAIVIRGTVPSKPTSVLEDLMAIMIAGAGVIPAGDVAIPYSFAEDPGASVHLGFALGALLLLYDAADGILFKVKQLVPADSELIFTGHSQGAAISTLVQAFFWANPWYLSPAARHRGYHFAQPKPGNDRFAREFELLQDGVRITNSLDWVPQLPLSLELLGSLNVPNPISVLEHSLEETFIFEAIAHLEEILGKLHLSKLQPKIDFLGGLQIWPGIPGQKFGPPLSSSQAPAFPLRGGLNFEPAGLPVTLVGKPGGNPADPTDGAWQHHAGTYAQLLVDQKLDAKAS